MLLLLMLMKVIQVYRLYSRLKIFHSISNIEQNRTTVFYAKYACSV